MKRKITFCIPGKTELQRRYLEGAKEMGLPTDSIALQIGVPHSFIPGEIELDEQLNQIERSYRAQLEGCPFPGRITRAFVNIEGIRDDGTWWLGDKMRHGYSEIDNLFLIESMEKIRQLMRDQSLPPKVGAYRIPVLPNRGGFNFTSFKNLLTAMPSIQASDWLWHNLYPEHGPITNRTITEENLPLHIDRIQDGAEVLEAVAVDKPVVGCIFPRYITDNLSYMNHYLPALLKTGITDLLVWSNPHNEFMTNIYLQELKEASEPLLKWLNTPVESEGPLKGAG